MGVTESRRKAYDNYNAKCDTIQIRPLREEGMAIRAAATAAGESLQGYILKACRMRMGKGESD